MTIQPSSLITTKAPHPQSVLRSKYRLEITTGLVKQVALLQAFANMGHLLPPELPLPARVGTQGGDPSAEGKTRPPGRLPRLVAAYAFSGMNRFRVVVDLSPTDWLILSGNGGGGNTPFVTYPLSSQTVISLTVVFPEVRTCGGHGDIAGGRNSLIQWPLLLYQNRSGTEESARAIQRVGLPGKNQRGRKKIHPPPGDQGG